MVVKAATGFQKGDGAEKAFIELLGSETELDEKRQKRGPSVAKRLTKRCPKIRHLTAPAVAPTPKQAGARLSANE